MTSLAQPAYDGAANRRGIIAMVVAMACFITNDTMTKIVAQDLPVGEIVAIRNAMSVVLVVGWIIVGGHVREVPRMASPLVLTRGLLEALVAVLYVSALATIPIADITAIFLITPLLITALSGPILKEQIGWRRWMAVLAGFAGMLLVVKPGGAGFVAGPATAMALGSVAFCAARDLITRFIDPRIPTIVVTLSTCLSVCLFGLAMMTFQPYVPPSGKHMTLLLCASVLVVVGNYAMVLAFRGVEVSLISPFRYSIMIWAIVSGITVFGQWPDGWSWLGMAFIVGAGLYTLHRERVRRRQRSAATEERTSVP